jgi:hypothetical protein
MAQAAEGNFASDFFRNALTKNMADVVYKDEKAIRNLVYRSYSLLKQAKVLEWGYKMLDPADAERSMKPTGVQLVSRLPACSPTSCVPTPHVHSHACCAHVQPWQSSDLRRLLAASRAQSRRSQLLPTDRVLSDHIGRWNLRPKHLLPP